MFKFIITSDNERGVLTKLCNLFTARSFNIKSLFANLVDEQKNISTIEITVDMPQEKVINMREKILQIIPIHEVKIIKEEEVFLL
jgi:acetolactate synthase small subunit